MQPPDLLPSSTAIHDALATASQTSPLLGGIMTTSTTLMFSIATAAASTTQASLFPLTSAFPSTPASVADTDDESSGECKLLGPFAILIQGALGALALLSLVYKRWRERPQRPLKIWSFDVSKQVVGSILLHLANLLMSMFSSGQIERALAKAAASTLGTETDDVYRPNPCSFYLLNLAIDTTIGIPILICILRILTIGASYTPLARPKESIESGHYGTPPKVTWWLKQCLIYFLGLLGMKACVFLIFQLCPWLGRVGDWALRWTEGNEAVQIAFVMLIFPLIMNALQYYIIDTFIKNNKGPRDADAEDRERGAEEEHGGLLEEDYPDHGHSIDEDEACKPSPPPLKAQAQSQSRAIITSYDPDKDGEVDASGSQGESSSLASHAEEEAVEHRPRI
ncbi:uncharacterized protein PV06_06804 [Exophiala oligosperma]|uniref:Vacuolar membrane protein n=1 Tax=Exophiala oligosperma TaxID=215243 RepID=A0A0D2E0A9_9EURO|nr:uncharacterized protein PV06_06804 [Exophiala oligosperma]KIW41229.1 hypothetical protein PV06_06804 [Exophiala oligosperma]